MGRGETLFLGDIRRRIVLLVSILVISFVGTIFYVRDSTIPYPPKLTKFPKQIMSWSGIDSTINNDVLLKLRLDDYLMRRYTQGNQNFWIYIGYYRDQMDGKKIHSPKHCYPASGWQKVESSIVWFRTNDVDGGEKSIPVNRFLVENGGEQELIYYWYQSESGAEASEIREIMNRFWAALSRKRLDGALVRISTRIRGGDVAAGEKMAEVIPIIYSYMAQDLFQSR